jgi:glutaredoxin
MMSALRIVHLGLLSSLSLALGACGKPAEAPAGGQEQSGPVVPPFAVRGELEGLLLVWFDQEGTHTATRRSDVPEPHRREVRIDSLHVAPDKRLDPDQVYVADLTAPGKDGSYPVRKTSRSWFDSRVVASRPAPEPAATGTDVTIYMASWCGACRSAAAYLRSRHVPFAERDIEKDSEANGEMLRKARAAGKSPSGVPVIDFRGHIILGFDRDQLARLIEST